MSYESLEAKDKAWARECALAIQTRREQVNAARKKARGTDDATKDKIMSDLKPTLGELDHYYQELRRMGLNETEIEQLIQLL